MENTKPITVCATEPTAVMSGADCHSDTITEVQFSVFLRQADRVKEITMARNLSKYVNQMYKKFFYLFYLKNNQAQIFKPIQEEQT